MILRHVYKRYLNVLTELWPNHGLTSIVYILNKEVLLIPASDWSAGASGCVAEPVQADSKTAQWLSVRAQTKHFNN